MNRGDKKPGKAATPLKRPAELEWKVPLAYDLPDSMSLKMSLEALSLWLGDRLAAGPPGQEERSGVGHRPGRSGLVLPQTLFLLQVLQGSWSFGAE